MPFNKRTYYQESGVALFFTNNVSWSPLQVVSIVVPAHHIFDVYAVTLSNTGQRVAFTYAIGNAIAVLARRCALLPAPTFSV